MQKLALSQDWARNLYAGFGEWLVAEHPSGRRLLPALKRHFGFFEAVDAGCHTLAEVTSGFLLDRFNVAGLRAHALPMRYLGARHGIAIDDGRKSDHVEQQRIRVILERNQKDPCGAVLERYDQWMVRRNIAVRTRRLYLSSAAHFCRAEAVGPTGRYTSAQVRHFLKRHPGLRANLFRWIAFGREALDCSADIPPATSRKRRPRTARDLAILLSKVEAAGPEHVQTEVLERTIAKAFGFTVAAFRGREWSVEEDGKNVWLCRDGERLRAPGALAPAVQAWGRRARR